jgi:hypothetical protein
MAGLLLACFALHLLANYAWRTLRWSASKPPPTFLHMPAVELLLVNLLAFPAAMYAVLLVVQAPGLQHKVLGGVVLVLVLGYLWLITALLLFIVRSKQALGLCTAEQLDHEDPNQQPLPGKASMPVTMTRQASRNSEAPLLGSQASMDSTSLTSPTTSSSSSLIGTSIMLGGGSRDNSSTALLLLPQPSGGKGDNGSSAAGKPAALDSVNSQASSRRMGRWLSSASSLGAPLRSSDSTSRPQRWYSGALFAESFRRSGRSDDSSRTWLRSFSRSSSSNSSSSSWCMAEEDDMAKLQAKGEGASQQGAASRASRASLTVAC